LLGDVDSVVEEDVVGARLVLNDPDRDAESEGVILDV